MCFEKVQPFSGSALCSDSQDGYPKCSVDCELARAANCAACPLGEFGPDSLGSHRYIPRYVRTYLGLPAVSSLGVGTAVPTVYLGMYLNHVQGLAPRHGPHS